MNSTKVINTSIYTMMTLFVCAISYIYVVKGLKCDPALGICSIAINMVLAYTIYKVVYAICEKGNTKHGFVQSSCIDITNMKKRTNERENKPMPVDTNKQDHHDKENQELIITECKTYMEKIVAPLFPENTKSNLLQLVEDYANASIRCAPIMIDINDTKGLRPIDFYHLVWNLWNRLNSLDRRASCRFIKNAFPLILSNTSEETIYRKMNDTYAKCTIVNVPKDEPLTT